MGFTSVAPQSALRVRRRGRGFTLIEIMVAIGIIAIVLAIGIPSVFQQIDKDSMRQAVKDVVEACSQARARAVLDGGVVELWIRPMDRQITVIATGSSSRSGEPAPEPVSLEGQPSRTGTIFSAKLSDRIYLEEALVFQEADRELENEVVCKFYPDGTADELLLRLASDRGEVRIIRTDVVTGIADVESVR